MERYLKIITVLFVAILFTFSVVFLYNVTEGFRGGGGGGGGHGFGGGRGGGIGRYGGRIAGGVGGVGVARHYGGRGWRRNYYGGYGGGGGGYGWYPWFWYPWYNSAPPPEYPYYYGSWYPQYWYNYPYNNLQM
jgi:hypothetical protein